MRDLLASDRPAGDAVGAARPGMRPGGTAAAGARRPAQPTAGQRLFGRAGQRSQVRRTAAAGARGGRALQGAARSGRQRPGRADRSGAEVAERSAAAARQDWRPLPIGAHGARPAAGDDPIARAAGRGAAPAAAAVRAGWPRWRPAARRSAAATSKQQIGGRLQRHRRPGLAVRGSRSMAAIRSIARCDQRRAAGRFRPAVRARRPARRLLQHAAAAVSSSRRPRRGVAAGGRRRPRPITPADLAQFQRAATIRDLFFAGGGNTPSVRFDITPVKLDPGAKQATLDLGGTTIVAITDRRARRRSPGRGRTRCDRAI